MRQARTDRARNGVGPRCMVVGSSRAPLAQITVTHGCATGPACSVPVRPELWPHRRQRRSRTACVVDEHLSLLGHTEGIVSGARHLERVVHDAQDVADARRAGHDHVATAGRARISGPEVAGGAPRIRNAHTIAVERQRTSVAAVAGDQRDVGTRRRRQRGPQSYQHEHRNPVRGDARRIDAFCRGGRTHGCGRNGVRGCWLIGQHSAPRRNGVSDRGARRPKCTMPC